MPQVRVEAKKGIKKSFGNLAFNAAKAKVNGAKEELIKDFDKSEVTQDLKAGAAGDEANSSKLVSRGSLYGFLGFDAGHDPTTEVRQLLTEINVSGPAQISETQNSVIFRFNVKVPTEDEVEQATPLHDRVSPRSWVRVVERGGLNNFNKFLHWITRGSVSGLGIQAKGKQNYSGSFTPTSNYLTKMLNNFIKRIREKS